MKIRISNAVNIDPPSLGPLEADQVSQQRALTASRSAEDSENGSALDLKRDVLHEHARSPAYPQIVDGDVGPW